MATNANKPAFDYEAHNQALDNFREDLRNHQWSFNCDSFYTYMNALQQEAEFFKEAQRLGIQGVSMFQFWQQQQGLIEVKRVASSKMAEQNKREIDRLKEQQELDRKRYMRPVDVYREEVMNLDWYYSFSDDSSVYRSGKARIEAAKQKAKEGSDDMKAIFMIYNESTNNQIQFRKSSVMGIENINELMTDDLIAMYKDRLEKSGTFNTFFFKKNEVFGF